MKPVLLLFSMSRFLRETSALTTNKMVAVKRNGVCCFSLGMIPKVEVRNKTIL